MPRDDDGARRRTATVGPYFATLVGTALALGAAMAVYATVWPERIHREVYAQWKYMDELSVKPAAPVDWLILGDSRTSAGVLAGNLGYECIALNASGATPIEIYYTLQHYLQHHVAPRAIAISVTPTHFYARRYFWEQGIAYSHLSRTEANEVFDTARALGDESLGSLRWLQVKRLAYRWHLPQLYFSEFRATLFISRAAENAAARAEMQNSHNHFYFGRAERSDDLSNDAMDPAFYVTKTIDAYFGRLVESALKTTNRVLYFTLPLNPRSATALTASYRNNYHSYMEGASARWPAVEWHTEWPVYSPEEFGDADHLNPRGATRFTRQLARTMRTILQ